MIRFALPADLEAIDRFDVFPGNPGQAIEDERCLVAEIGGRVVGYLSWVRKGFVGRDYITQVCIDEPYRRLGYGRLLIAAAETRIGSGRLFISTEADNAPMLAVLGRDGWTPAGCVAGANKDGTAECFFYKDLADAK